MASDSTESLTREEAKRILRRLELEAYGSIVTAFRAQGDLDRTKKQALQDLATHLSISNERHQAEIRRVVSDDHLNAVAESIHGPSSATAWILEGRRLISLLPRLVPQTAFSAKATVAANAIVSDKGRLKKKAALAATSSQSEAKIRAPSPGLTSEQHTSVKQTTSKPDLFNNAVCPGTSSELHKTDEAKSPNLDKTKRKKKHTASNRIQSPKVSPSVITNKAVPKCPLSTFKSPVTLTPSSSPSKNLTAGFAKYHNKPIILQRSSPLKSPQHSETKLSNLSATVSSSSTPTTTVSVTSLSIPGRPAITSFTTSPTGGLIPINYNSSTSVSPGLSPSKIKFKAPLPRQRGKPSKFKTIGQSSRTISLPSTSLASDPMNVLATPTGIPITPISPNKTQSSPVSTTPSLTQSNPCTVKVVQIPRTTSPSSTTTSPSTAATTIKSSQAFTSVATSKTPAQRVLTFSNLQGHSGQQLKIASIPNVLQQSGALASTAKLVSISKSVPMATGFKMISVTTMVPGSSQVKTVYIATPIMSLTKSVTHGTGSIISTSIHNRKRTPNTNSGSTSVTTTASAAPQPSTTSSISRISALASTASLQTCTSSTCPTTANVTTSLPPKPVTSILSLSSQIGKDRDCLIISPVRSNSGKSLSIPVSDSGIKEKVVVNSLSETRLPTNNGAIVCSGSLSKMDGGNINTNSEGDILSAGESFIANLTAKFSKTGSVDLTPGVQSYQTSTLLGTRGGDSGNDPSTSKELKITSSPPERDAIAMDLSAKETLDDEESGSFLAINPSTSQKITTATQERSLAGKNSVMFLSSEDGIWSGSNTLRKGTVPQATKLLSEDGNNSTKKSGLSGKPSSSMNCIVTKTDIIVKSEPVSSPASCQCGTSPSNSITTSLKEQTPSLTSVAPVTSVLTNPLSVVPETNILSSPERKKQKLIHVTTLKGFSYDSKSSSGSKNCHKFELLGSDKKTFNKFIPIQNQTKEISMGTSKIESSQYTSTLRDLNKLFFNQSESSAGDRGRSSAMNDGKCNTDNGVVSGDALHWSTVHKFSGKIISPAKQLECLSGSDFSSSNSSFSVENDSYSDVDDKSTSPIGSTDSSGFYISQSQRKRKMVDGKDSSQRYQPGWVRSAQLLLQRVSRYRGSNKQKGEMNASSWFARPVDPEDAPGYYKIIKSPMDFSTIRGKLENGSYQDYTEFFADMQLIKKNCHTYNPPEHPARKDCDDVFSFFEVEYKKILERWQRCHVSPTKKLKGNSGSLTEELSSKN